jgi:hypothetical protein
MIVTMLVAVMLAPSLAYAGEAAAQKAAPQTLAAVAAEHAAKTQADRQVILDVLARQDVRQVATSANLPIDRAAAAVATLQGQELAQVAAQAQQVSDALAGGQSITLSVWLIIIALLVIILIVVA